jgi:hypothetical protein
MPTYFQPVQLPERCLLSEVLAWLAFQRLPIFETDHDGVDIRESSEDIGYVLEVGLGFVDAEECKRANIPVDPRYLAAVEYGSFLSVSEYNEILKKYPDIDPALREQLEDVQGEAEDLQTSLMSWRRHYEKVIEYPMSRIFVALREGQLRAAGRLLPTLDRKEAEKMGSEIFEIEPSEIPKDFWGLQGIDFEASTAVGGARHYCHISFNTDEVLKVFPGDREVVINVERVGGALVFESSAKPSPLKTQTRRGRPPYQWEAFHHEVTALLLGKTLPEKREAAIVHFQNWFQKKMGVCPSRAAIGEKLTPYYQKYMRRSGQKI